MVSPISTSSSSSSKLRLRPSLSSSRVRLLLGTFVIGTLSILNHTAPSLLSSTFGFAFGLGFDSAYAAHVPTTTTTTTPAEAPSLLSKADHRLLLRHAFTLQHVDNDTRKPYHRKTVIVTVGSNDVINFVHNLRCFIHAHTSSSTEGGGKIKAAAAAAKQQQQLVLFSLDSNMTKLATAASIPVIAWHRVSDKQQNTTINTTSTSSSTSMNNPHLFGTKEFSGITLSKLSIVDAILKLGIDIIFTDVDTIWCRDIRAQFQSYISSYPSMNMFMQSNGRNASIISQLNTGFYYAKSSTHTRALFHGLVTQSAHWYNRSGDDQTLFWGYACSGGRIVDGPEDNGVYMHHDSGSFVCAWNRFNSSVNIMYLPIATFPNGAADPEGRALVHIPKGFYRKACRNHDVALWHVNYCKGDMKERRLKEQDVWIINENNQTCQTI